jgi:DnaK suppressor protein
LGKKEKNMTKTELEKFKNILLEKQAELERFVRNRDGIAIEKAADAIDEVQHATERELAIRNLDRETILLRNVRNALRRIKDGSYGVCMHCEEDISLKRVNAVPWAPFCIQCQEEADRQRAEGEETFEEDLLNAA